MPVLINGFSYTPPPAVTIPSSVIGLWDASNIGSLVGLTGVADVSGNSAPEMAFGATPPTLGTNPVNGKSYLQFTKDVTDKLVSTGFTTAISTATNPFAMMIALSVQESNGDVGTGRIFHNAHRRIRVLNDDLDYTYQNLGGGDSKSTTVISNYPKTADTVLLLVVYDDGGGNKKLSDLVRLQRLQRREAWRISSRSISGGSKHAWCHRSYRRYDNQRLPGIY